jgi:hypothetical protein
VINPFRRRSKAPLKALLDEVEAQFKDLDGRFRRMEESMDRLSAKFPQVTIENVHIHQPVLEKLEFRLDGLDIEHLSGSLNLGNNFGAKTATERREPQSDPEPKHSKSAVPHDERPDPSMPGLHRTLSGFRLNNRR